MGVDYSGFCDEPSAGGASPLSVIFKTKAAVNVLLV